jgi:hypothetical protein
MTPMPRIGYATTGRLLAVLDDEAAADRAVAALAADGWDPSAIERLTGEAAADAFDSTGAGSGVLGRLRRALEFGLVDQMPDLAWYEAAARMGKVVLAVPAADAATGARAGRLIETAGGHFINRYGRFETQELVRWRGPEPPVSHLLKR